MNVQTYGIKEDRRAHITLSENFVLIASYVLCLNHKLLARSILIPPSTNNEQCESVAATTSS